MTFRNPVIYAQELHDEMVRDSLTRKELAQRHGVSSDRITQSRVRFMLIFGKYRILSNVKLDFYR